jgi:repressor LexA
MIGAGINDGDLIVATITNYADDGEIMVALINDSATVKRLYRKNGYAILHAENPKYDDIYYNIITKELTIQGVVEHVIHNF